MRRTWSAVPTLALAAALVGSAAYATEDREAAVEPAAGSPLAGRAVQAATLPPEGEIALDLEGAILQALSRNRALRVESLRPAIRRTQEGIERAVFDPVVSAEAVYDRARDQAVDRTPPDRSATTEQPHGSVAVENAIPSGTTLRAEASGSYLDSELYEDRLAAARVGLTVTQALLRGVSWRGNLARLDQARLDSQASDYEFRAFVEALTAEVERAYWDLALAGRQVTIVEESLTVSERQVQETSERVKVGRISEAELAPIQAEAAVRREELIDARATCDTRRLALLRLLNPEGDNLWDRPVRLTLAPALPPGELDPVEDHVAVATRLRPDLNQARLAVRRGTLEVVRTRNGLMPRLDAFVALGTSGYGDTFGDAVQQVNGRHYDVSAGVRFEVPPLNRAAESEHARARLTRDQATRAVENLVQLIALEVRSAYIEAVRTRAQVAATADTRARREEALWAETEKFKVGKTSSLLVAQAQRDMLASRLKEVAAVTSHLKAMVDLYRIEGSLIERRGLSAPGAEPAGMD